MYSELLSLVERIVTHPLYYLVGIASDRLIYESTVEKTTDLWSMPIDEGEAIKLASRVVEVSRPRHGDDKIFYTLDVSKGKELHKVYLVDVDGGEQYEAFEMEPVRIMGMAHLEDKIAYSGASQKDNALYLSEIDGEAEKVYSNPMWLFVSDMNDKYVVGGGPLAGDPKSLEIFVYSILDNEFKIYTPKPGSFNLPSMIYKDKILLTSNWEGEKKLYLYDIKKETLFEPVFEGDEYRKFKFDDYQNYGFTDEGEIWFVGLSNYRGYAFLDGYSIYHPEGTPGNIDVYKEKIYMTFSNLKTPYGVYKTGFDKEEWSRVVGEELD
ncbi:hypothetical protein DRN84_04210, partial [Candidatus Geothermarchaeota archaeon]